MSELHPTFLMRSSLGQEDLYPHFIIIMYVGNNFYFRSDSTLIIFVEM
jgi:hypothetical protein